MSQEWISFDVERLDDNTWRATYNNKRFKGDTPEEVVARVICATGNLKYNEKIDLSQIKINNNEPF